MKHNPPTSGEYLLKVYLNGELIFSGATYYSQHSGWAYDFENTRCRIDWEYL